MEFFPFLLRLSTLLQWGIFGYTRFLGGGGKFSLSLSKKFLKHVFITPFSYKISKYNTDTQNLYVTSKIIKFEDQIKLENFLYAHSSLKGNIPSPLQNLFFIRSDLCDPSTRGSTLTKLILPKVRTQNYGIFSIKYRATAYWNLLMGKFPDNKFIDLTRATVKEKIVSYFFENYTN